MGPLNEEAAVRNLGNALGYGRLMQLTEQIWAKKCIDRKTPGMEFSIGPCGGELVPCPHPDVVAGLEKHCSWCANSGRVTRRVLRAMEETTALRAALTPFTLKDVPVYEDTTWCDFRIKAERVREARAALNQGTGE